MYLSQKNDKTIGLWISIHYANTDKHYALELAINNLFIGDPYQSNLCSDLQTVAIHPAALGSGMMK